MQVRTSKDEMVEVIKDMTKSLDDCGHTNPDPNSCFICYGKVFTRAFDEGELLIIDKPLTTGVDHVNYRTDAKVRKADRLKVSALQK